MAISRLAVRYASGGPGTPFFAYAAAVRQCVAIKAPNIYLSNPAGTPPSAHLKQRSAVAISTLDSAYMAAYSALATLQNRPFQRRNSINK